MSDESWWSGVAHQDDEVSLGDRLTVEHPALPEASPAAPERTLTDGPAVAADEPPTEPFAAVPPAPAPVVLDPEPSVDPLPPGPPPAPADLLPPAAAPDVPALDTSGHEAPADDDVAFWLLPAPPRPGAPAPTGAVPVAPAPAPFPDVPVPPLAGAAPAPSVTAPSAPSTTRLAARGVVPVTRRRPGSGGPVVSVGAASGSARARELLERGTAALGPLGARIRATHPVILGAAAAFVLGLLVVLVSLVTFGGGDAPTTATRTPSRTAASPSLAPVDRTTVTASASSVQDAEGKTTYTAANTLDGRPETAWNSNGRKDGAGPGITLTYTFDNLVDLRSITMRDGYIKTVEGKNGPQDLFTANSRVKALKVTTDTASFTWTLDDVKSAQTLRKAFGRTKTVTLEIVSIYKGSKYRDVAISEVSFAAAG